MPTIQEKTMRLEEIKAKIEALRDAGVDLKSKEAVPLGLEFLHAFDYVAREFGYVIIKPIDN